MIELALSTALARDAPLSHSHSMPLAVSLRECALLSKRNQTLLTPIYLRISPSVLLLAHGTKAGKLLILRRALASLAMRLGAAQHWRQIEDDVSISTCCCKRIRQHPSGRRRVDKYKNHATDSASENLH